MPKNRRAFTLLEILIIIGIIGVLVGLLVFGASKMIGGSKAESTKVSLATLQGMLAEYDAKTRLSKPPPAWTWIGATAAVGSVSASGSIDFWRIPANVTPPVYRAPDALDAPGSVVADEAGNLVRNGSRAVLNTQVVMGMLLGMTNNRTALGQIPADRQLTPEWVGGTMLAPGTDGVRYTSDDVPATSGEPVHYLFGARMVYKGKRYICKADHDYTTTSLPNTPTANWDPDMTPAVPVLLDAWGNPIIFVPGTGLRVRLLNGASANTPSNLDQTFIIVSPEGKVARTSPTNGNPYVVQPGRPFWASAGPDGDFAKGDDNLYSFEK